MGLKNSFSPNLIEWLANATQQHSKNLSDLVKIVGIIGKDYPDHGKGEIINCFLNEAVFPISTEKDEILTIRAHYSEEHQILFLLMNGIDDVENLKSIFCSENSVKQSFFEKLAESEEKQLKMLHFLFITCHFIIMAEQTSRVDIENLRNFQKVNSLRINSRSKIDKLLEDSSLKNVNFTSISLSASEKQGRINVPRLLIAVQRNNIRSDVGVARKKEIYEKLEKNLDSQFAEMLSSFKLTDAGSESLCHINSHYPFVHLLNPKVIERDVIQEMFDVFLQDPETRTVPVISKNNSFSRFLENNFQSEKNTASLESVIEALSCLTCVLDEIPGNEDLKKYNFYLSFEQKLFENHLNESFTIYERENNNARSNNRRDLSYSIPERSSIRTKAEHDSRFAEAVKYLQSVLGSRLEEALEILENRCNEVWQSDMRACEQISLTGIPCIRKVHPTFGDQTCDEKKWTAHDSSETMISTCACGRKQALREDPFSVKEANFDFFENNAEFDCCQKLEKYSFRLYQEDLEDKEDWNSWVERESNSLIGQETKEIIQKDEESIIEEDNMSAEEEDEDDENEDFDNNVISQQTASSSESEDVYIRSSRKNRKDDDEDADFFQESKSSWETTIEYAKRLNSLKMAGKEAEFLEGVANSVITGRLPLFPSWILTCLGHSSIYNHSAGVRNQPNFKIGGEYLIPTVVFVDCDVNVWNRDLDRMKSEEFQKRHISKPKSMEETARVKIFVGFEYECSRGHRFFVDHYGEPLIYPKGANVVKESTRRASLTEILNVDLPLRRACTCRKLPLKSAQLMKIHVITPKAPVTVTINPQIEVPGHEGFYQTGEQPLELENSKYYILQLPMVYSGPNGVYIHDRTNLEKVGKLKAGAIQITHKPYFMSRWK